MKNEKAFSKNGFYKFVLDSNLMLHQHVAAAGTQVLTDWLKSQPLQKQIAVLDLACGGEPVSISKMLNNFPQRIFHYTGIDINSDQIEHAKTQFKFPDNVKTINLIEGDAWNIEFLPDKKFDIIFTGMNLHHGTPEEIHCLLLQSVKKLSPSGIFINHDEYRPKHLPYLRRPNANPQNPSESFTMIQDNLLAAYQSTSLTFKEANPSNDSDWRATIFIEPYIEALKLRGAHSQGIKEVVSHVMTRDFPISVLEMEAIVDKAGFTYSYIDLKAQNEPLEQFFALIVARPKDRQALKKGAVSKRQTNSTYPISFFLLFNV